MGYKINVRPKTRAQLMAIANPESANQPEAIPWVLYDTQTYISGTTTQLRFFANTNADQTLSNMESAGQLPDPQWFEVHYVMLTSLATPSASDVIAVGAAGAINDLELLLKAGRGTFQLNLSNKNYGPFPLTNLHASGGTTGEFSGGGGTIATVDIVQLANNGTFDGGWCVGGSIVFPPKVGWNWNVAWAAAQTLAAGNTLLRMELAGVLYRRVL